MSNQSKVIINAPAQKVWEALTEPELVKQWQYGSNVITDWKPGSPIKYLSEWKGTLYEQWGNILDIKQNELLKYTLFAPRPGLEDKPENYFTMTYRLEEANGVTTLIITQDDSRTQNEPVTQDDDENGILKGLKRLVENQ